MQPGRFLPETLDRFLELTDDMLCVVDSEGRFLEVNPAWTRTLGWSPEELIGSRYIDFVHPDDVARTRLVDTSRRGDRFENRYRKKDGRHVWISWRWAPCDESGRVYAIAHNVTEQKAADNELQELRKLHEAIIRHVPAGVLYLNAEGVITFENAYLRGIMAGGGPDSPPKGWHQRIFDLPSLQGHPEFLGRVRELLAGRAFTCHTLAYRSLSGKDLVLEVSGVPVRAPEDVVSQGPVGAVLLVQDMTERRVAEEERLRGLARLHELEHLKEVDAFKTRFLNTTAHELCTPLTPIRLQLHLLSSRKDLGEQERRSLDVVSRNFSRLERLVRDMMDASKLQTGNLGVLRHPLDLRDVLAEAVESFQQPAAEAGVVLESVLIDGLRIPGDAQRLHQVMFNLLGNALRFTPSGGRVCVVMRRERGAAVVRVEDTGRGIAHADVPRLFRPFGQVHADDAGHGTGLGLYICKGILELHGGRIWCESGGAGMGATFAFSIPLLEEFQ